MAFDGLRSDYRVIAADPPWHFKSNSAAAPGRNAMRHYDCMSLDAINKLPVSNIGFESFEVETSPERVSGQIALKG